MNEHMQTHNVMTDRGGKACTSRVWQPKTCNVMRRVRMKRPGIEGTPSE